MDLSSITVKIIFQIFSFSFMDKTSITEPLLNPSGAPKEETPGIIVSIYRSFSN